jgi:magnesium transporter
VRQRLDLCGKLVLRSPDDGYPRDPVSAISLLEPAVRAAALPVIATCPTGDPEAAVWIDLLAPTRDEIARVSSITGLRVPTQEQVSEIESTSRLAFEKGSYYLSTPLVAPQPSGEYALVPAGFVLSTKHLVTVRFAPIASIEAALSQPAPSAESAFLKILETIIDRSADALERASSDSDEISHEAFRREPRKDALRETLRRVGALADRTSRIRDALLGLDRITGYVSDPSVEGAPKLNAARIKAIRADLASLSEYQSHLSGKIQFLLDATLGFINVEQNDIVKTLTIASVVGIPPVLFVGIWGMNFKFMPELSWRLGYPFALVVIVVSGVVPYLWFKRRGWT